MKRLFLIAAVQMMSLGAAWAQAQSNFVQVRFDASPCGRFLVDGQMYEKGASFAWSLYSQHTLQVAASYPISSDIMCNTGVDGGLGDPVIITLTDSVLSDGKKTIAFKNGTASYTIPSSYRYKISYIVLGPSFPAPGGGSCYGITSSVGSEVGQGASTTLTRSVTADPKDQVFYVAANTGFPPPPFPAQIEQEIVSVKAMDVDPSTGEGVWTVQRGYNNTSPAAHLVGTKIAQLTSAQGVTGECYYPNGVVWVDDGIGLAVQAIAPPGLVFGNWIGDFAQFGALPIVRIDHVHQPYVIRAVFVQGVPVVIASDPPNMKVMVDHGIVNTPAAYTWAPGSVHAISPVSPQTVGFSGDLWAFFSWSDGGKENRLLTLPNTLDPIELTVKYAPAARVGFNTAPSGLLLMVDGLSYTRNYNFVWALGSKHTVSAPLQQKMAGRAYVFREWSTGGAAEQQVTAPSTGSAPARIAYYDVLGQLRVQSTPPGMVLTVDGAPCITPCVVDRKAGTQVKFSAPATINVANGTRLDLQGWSDGGTGERTWTADTSAKVVTANYQTSYRVQTASDPAGSIAFAFEPASPDGYFPGNSTISVTATANPGYKFKYWAGNEWSSPLSATQTIQVIAPMALNVAAESVPYIAIDGVQNAAGVTPEKVVAPGSVISILGANLAPAAEQSPDSPLAQMLAGVTVQVNDRLLPLVSVAPARIDALLFSDLGEGDYSLTVHQPSLPDIGAQFKVKRDAPGLFATTIDGKDYAVALHSDGTPVTADSPALHGETVTLLGTGFGPYQFPLPDGFLIPAAFPDVAVVDSVELRSGDAIVLHPVSAKAAKGYAGRTAIALKISDDLPANTTVELRAAMPDKSDPEGKAYIESNTVLLPVK